MIHHFYHNPDCRTYNASYTLQQQLDELTDPDDNVAAKMLSYNRANREVAVLCNHQVIHYS